MSLIKKIFTTLLLATTLITLGACHSKTTSPNTLKVGTIAGPDAELLEVAKKYAAEKEQLNIEIVTFTDYNMPNQALADGSIDANMFQHLPYLEDAKKARGYPLIAVAKTFIFPMGLYSRKYTPIHSLPDKSVVAIPNDPSNMARALLLLQKAGLISLSPQKGNDATVTDITANPHHLVFKELDAAQLPRALSDVDLAAINTNYAFVAGLTPSKDALILENRNSPYANIIVTRENLQHDLRINKLINALHSEPVIQKAKALFKDQAISAWQ